MAESYENIISRLSGTPVEVDKKPATDFATYVRTLLDNTSPRGNMFTRQDEIDRINQTNLSEELEKKKIEEEITKIVKEVSTGMFGGGGDYGYDSPESPNTGQGPLGVGDATDAINMQAVQDAVMGFATGGIPGAIQSAIQSLATNTIGFLGSVNSSPDPLQAWAIAQGHAPVEVVDLSTPFGGMFGATTSPVDNAPLGPAVDLGTLDAPTAAAGGGVTTSPVDNAPLGPAVDLGTLDAPTADAGGDGDGDGDGCCFIMLEARYGDGTMDSVVRKYRDEMMTDRNRRGYYKLAEVFVPLMRKSKVFKFLVKKTFADPLVSYGKWHYKENNHGWLFAPVKTLWMRVFDTLGGDTKFIRENGEVV